MRTMTQKLYWTQYKNSPKICEKPNCNALVTSAVPISPNCPRDYRWLCRSCARHHNENWNYKHGKSDVEIEHIIRDDMCWNRPTQPFSHLHDRDNIHLQPAIQDFMGQDFMGDVIHISKLHQLPQNIQDAYAILELSEPLEKEALKSHYKQLVKQYHPDTTPYTAHMDDKIKNINVAYDTITEYINSEK